MNKVSRTIAVAATAALALAAVATPALAHRGKGSGKKAMGTIASFDGTTLTVTTTGGETVTATVTEDTRIKVEHRGHHGRGKGHGNPSRGSADNFTAGTFVLKMKIAEDGTLEKIRVRPSALHTPEPTEEPAEEEPATEEPATEEPAQEEPAQEEPATEEPAETPAA